MKWALQARNSGITTCCIAAQKLDVSQRGGFGADARLGRASVLEPDCSSRNPQMSCTGMTVTLHILMDCQVVPHCDTPCHAQIGRAHVLISRACSRHTRFPWGGEKHLPATEISVPRGKRSDGVSDNTPASQRYGSPSHRVHKRQSRAQAKGNESSCFAGAEAQCNRRRAGRRSS